MTMKEVFGDQIDKDNFGKTLSGALVLVGPQKEAGALAIKYHDRLVEALIRSQGYHLMHLDVPDNELTFDELNASSVAYHSAKDVLSELVGDRPVKKSDKPNFLSPKKSGRTKIVDKNGEVICDCRDEWTRDIIFASIIDTNDHDALTSINDQFNKALRSLKIAGFKDNGGELWQPPVNTQAGETIQRLINSERKLAETLERFVNFYCEGVISGDGGNWNPEEEQAVVEAKAALKMAKGALTELIEASDKS